jgi:hypothetical protein
MWRTSKNFTIACKAAVGFVTEVVFNCIAGTGGVAIREPRITEGREIERTNFPQPLAIFVGDPGEGDSHAKARVGYAYLSYCLNSKTIVFEPQVEQRADGAADSR